MKGFALKSYSKIIVFSLASILAFMLFVEIFVPKIVPRSSPLDALETGAGGETGIAALVRIGEAIYNGKGGCSLCHDQGGERAPSLEYLEATASERIADESYSGSAEGPWQYVVESLLEPSAFVVPGYGTEESTMPGYSGKLSEDELRALVAYLKFRSKASVDLLQVEPLQEEVE